jgi:glycosyltransferase involved in cell wall biosynthesis
MHTVQIIDTLKIGGAQKLLITFAAKAQARQVHVTVISLSGDNEPQIVNELNNLGVRVYILPPLVKGILGLERSGQIAHILRRENCNLVHTHLTYANIVGTFAGRWAGMPTVASLHNVRVERSSGTPKHSRVKSWLEVQALRHGASRVIAVGHLVAETYQGLFPNKAIEIVPNAVETILPLSVQERIRLRTELVGNPDRPLLIAVGRLTAQKAYADLLVAFNELRQSHPAAALIIVGGGTSRDEIETQITDLNLTGHAFLLGKRADVPRLLAASDIFINASHWEGLPVAVLEAMSAGLPVVGTAVGDVPKVVVKGTGLIVPPKEPQQLASAICSLLDNPAQAQQLGNTARAYANHHFSASAWTNTLLHLYQETLKTGHYRYQTEPIFAADEKEPNK